MSEQKKKEEKKKTEQIVSGELANISTVILNALGTKEQINSMVQTTLKSLQPSLAGLNHLSETLNNMSPVYEMIRQNQAIFQSIQTSNLTAILDSLRQVNQLSETLVRINEMMQLPKISIPKLETELKAISPKNNILVKSLLSQIEYLENELAKEKGKNKELLALLDEKRKKLKKQYIA